METFVIIQTWAKVQAGKGEETKGSLESTHEKEIKYFEWDTGKKKRGVWDVGEVVTVCQEGKQWYQVENWEVRRRN